MDTNTKHYSINGTIDGQDYIDFCGCGHTKKDHAHMQSGLCDMLDKDNDCPCTGYYNMFRVFVPDPDMGAYRLERYN